MRPSRNPRTWLGWLALLGAIALGSPGVKVAAAGSDGSAGAAPACSAGGAAQDAELAGFLRQVRQQAEARAAQERARDPGAEAAVVLNNRGYNYGAAHEVDPGSVPREPVQR